jgi:hypothetical protein
VHIIRSHFSALSIDLHATPAVGLAANGIGVRREFHFEFGNLWMCWNHATFHDSLPHFPLFVIGEADFKFSVVNYFSEGEGLTPFWKNEAEIDSAGLSEIISPVVQSPEDSSVFVVRKMWCGHFCCGLSSLLHNV